MSDNWIALIPEDPHLVPDQEKRERARDRFAEIAPDAEEVEINRGTVAGLGVENDNRRPDFSGRRSDALRLRRVR